MRNAYTLLGIIFIMLLVGVWYAFERGAQEGPFTSNNTTSSMNDFKLTSSAFEEGGLIPPLYSCDGENISPPLAISGAPEGTRSLALIMDDPDIPEAVRARFGERFVHWVVFNMPPETLELAAGAPAPGIEGVNSTGERGYTGPCPPDREHRYFFKLYALDTPLDISAGASADELERAMGGHILASTTLMGRYDRAR